MKFQKTIFNQYFFVLFILIITAFYFLKFDKWDAKSDNLILNHAFELHYKHWTCFGKGQNFIKQDDSGSHVILENNSLQTFCGILQEFKENKDNDDKSSTYKLKADISIKFLKKSEKNLHSPYIMILKKNFLNQIDWKNPVFFTFLNKNSDLFKLNRIIKLNDNVKDYIFIAGINGSSAIFSISNISFQAVEISKLSNNLRKYLFIINIFAFLLVLYFIPNLQYKNILLIILLLTLMGMIIPNSLLKNFVKLFMPLLHSQNKAIIPETIENIWSPLKLLYIKNEMFLIQIKAITHFLSFFFVASMATYIYSNTNLILFYLVSFAWFTEQFQYFTLTRLPSISSFLINIIGIIVGITVIKIWKKYIYERL